MLRISGPFEDETPATRKIEGRIVLRSLARESEAGGPIALRRRANGGDTS